MNDVLQIVLPENPPAYEPRQELVGTLSWKRTKPFKTIQLHLYWFTSGKGDVDSTIVETLEWENCGVEGERFFEIRLPRAPYSLKSENLEIHWRLEATGDPGKDRAEVNLTIAPGKQPLDLKTVEDPDGKLKSFKGWFTVG